MREFLNYLDTINEILNQSIFPSFQEQREIIDIPPEEVIDLSDEFNPKEIEDGTTIRAN